MLGADEFVVKPPRFLVAEVDNPLRGARESHGGRKQTSSRRHARLDRARQRFERNAHFDEHLGADALGVIGDGEQEVGRLHGRVRPFLGTILRGGYGEACAIRKELPHV